VRMRSILIDTHAHLQWPAFDQDREKVIERAFAAGLSTIVSVGYDLNASREAVQIANDHENIYAVVGIHPHNAKTMTASMLNSIRELAQNTKVVAIGEIGLDYYRDLSPRAQQKEAFEQQILLAKELDLPIVVHDREAHNDVLEVIRRFGRNVNGVLHCFSGDLKMAEEVIDLGYSISIAGPVTFPSARGLQQVVQRVPEGSIVLETDCPFLAPQSKRGERNEPMYVLETATKVAELRGMQLDELVGLTSQNAKRRFEID
jgi:TatD DNase family protein